MAKTVPWWAKQIVLSSSGSTIQSLTTESLRLDNLLNEACSVIKALANFDFVAIQLVRPAENYIESVYGIGVAKDWSERAKHYMEEDLESCDIQAHIAQTGLTEFIVGSDPRFDSWIYTEYGHDEYARIFVPLSVVNRKDGEVEESWIENVEYQKKIDKNDLDKRHLVLQIGPEITEPGVEVIGTVEAGYCHPKRDISVECIVSLYKLCSKLAVGIYKLLLPYGLRSLVEEMKRDTEAELVILRFLYSQEKGKFIYEATASDACRDNLSLIEAYISNESSVAFEEKKPVFIPINIEGNDFHSILREQNGDGILLTYPFTINHSKTSESEHNLAGMLYFYFNNPELLTEEVFLRISGFVNRLSDSLWNLITYIKMREQARQLRILHSVAASLARIPDSKNLLSQIAWNTLNILAADIITIYEYIASEKKFVTPPSIAGRLKVGQQMRADFSGDEIPFRLLRFGSNKYATRTEDEPLFKSSKPEPFVFREGIKSSAGILLKVDQEIVGTLFINYRHYHFFSDNDKQIIDTLASSAAVAIKNQRWLDAINEVDRDLISTLDQGDLLAKIVRKAVQITAANLGEIRLLDLGTQELVMKARFPEDAEIDEQWNRTSIKNGGEGITGWVANHRRSRIVYDVDEEREVYKPFFQDAKSELCVPLLGGDNGLLGVLNVESSQVAAFSGRDQKRLEALADLVVVALQNVQSNEQRMAAERVATLNHIARSIFHRMNNHLGAADIWAKRIIDGSPDYQDLANKIRRELTQALDDRKRIRSWLDILQPVDIKQTIRLSYSRASVPTSIKVRISVPEHLPKVIGSQEQLQDSFYNLIKNAVDAMADGGDLSVDVIDMENEKQRWIIVQFTDTGIGISQENQQKIFLREYSTKAEHDGEGLWLTKTYIEKLGGQITVESSPGQGAKFTVLLPAVDEKPY